MAGKMTQKQMEASRRDMAQDKRNGVSENSAEDKRADRKMTGTPSAAGKKKSGK